MWPAVIVELDLVGDDTRRVLQVLKAVTMDTMFLHRPDYTFNHSVLPRTVQSDALLLQSVAADDLRVLSARKHEAVVRAKHEW